MAANFRKREKDPLSAVTWSEREHHFQHTCILGEKDIQRRFRYRPAEIGGGGESPGRAKKGKKKAQERRSC